MQASTHINLGQCRDATEGTRCINLATKYDNLCNYHRREQHDNKLFQTLFSSALETMTDKNNLPAKQIKKTVHQAAVKMQYKVTTMRDINVRHPFTHSLSLPRARFISKRIFCAALAYHADPIGSYDASTIDRVTWKYKIRTYSAGYPADKRLLKTMRQQQIADANDAPTDREN